MVLIKAKGEYYHRQKTAIENGEIEIITIDGVTTAVGDENSVKSSKSKKTKKSSDAEKEFGECLRHMFTKGETLFVIVVVPSHLFTLHVPVHL